MVKERTRNSKTKSDFTLVSYVFYSDNDSYNDSYVDKKLSVDFAEKLVSKKILIRGRKHLNSESGFDDFPLVLSYVLKIQKSKIKIQNDNVKFKIKRAKISDLKIIQKLNFEVFEASLVYETFR